MLSYLKYSELKQVTGLHSNSTHYHTVNCMVSASIPGPEFE